VTETNFVVEWLTFLIRFKEFLSFSFGLLIR